MTIYDDIITNNVIGDPEHTEQHNILGLAVKDLDVRVSAIGTGPDGITGGVWGNWVIGALAPGPALPEGEGHVVFIESGPMVATGIRVIDDDGNDWSSLITSVGTGVRIKFVDVENPNSYVIVKLNDGVAFTISDGWGTGLGIFLEGDAETLSPTTNVYVLFELFTPMGSGGGDAPTLDEVMTAGSTAKGVITLENGAGTDQLLLSFAGITFANPFTSGVYNSESWTLGPDVGTPPAEGESQYMVSAYGGNGSVTFSQIKTVGGVINNDSVTLSAEALEVGNVVREIKLPDESGSVVLRTSKSGVPISTWGYIPHAVIPNGGTAPADPPAIGIVIELGE